MHFPSMSRNGQVATVVEMDKLSSSDYSKDYEQYQCTCLHYMHMSPRTLTCTSLETCPMYLENLRI